MLGTKDIEPLKQHLQTAKTRELRPPNSARPARVTQLLWSPDGRRLLAVYSDGALRCFSHPSFTDCQEVPIDITGPLLAAWHPMEHSLLATASKSHGIVILDMQNNTSVSTTTHAFPEPLIHMAWNTDGTKLAVGCRDDSIHIFPYPGDSLATFGQPIRCAFEANQFVFSDDHLLIASGPGSLSILDLQTAQLTRSLPCGTASAYSLAANGRFAAVGTSDAVVSLVDLQQFLCVSSVARQEWPARCLSISQDAQLLAIGSDDRFIDISLLPSSELVYRLPVSAGVAALAWHPTCNQLAWAADDVDKNGRPEGILRVLVSNTTQDQLFRL